MIVGTGITGKLDLKCEDCGKERRVQRCTAILEKPEHPCRACSNKRNGLRKVGRPSWNSKVKFEPKSIGSKYIDTHGYVAVYLGKNNPDVRKGGYVLEHRLVMETKLGRKLEPNEIVHHIDNDKLNNIESNLFLCSSQSDHREIHNSMESVAFELFKMGLIVFNETDKKYLIAPHIGNDMLNRVNSGKL